MAGIAISLLWLLIGAVCLAGVIYLVIYGISSARQSQVAPLPPVPLPPPSICKGC